MASGAVLDTCVLCPFSLCDILLRLADREPYDPYWSDRILVELARNLVEHGLTPGQARRRVEQMRQAFPAAEVSRAAVARLEPQMTNEPKDRHVLAAAVACEAEAVVTFNLRDFSAEACDPFGVEVQHPDEFLVDLHDLDAEAVHLEITAQAAALRRPPVTREELVHMLERAGVVNFAARIRADWMRVG
jgi:predicted nucleic acid-binding protein